MFLVGLRRVIRVSVVLTCAHVPQRHEWELVERTIGVHRLSILVIDVHKYKNTQIQEPKLRYQFLEHRQNDFLDNLNVFWNSHTSYHETRLPFLQIAGSGFLPLPIVTSPLHPHSFTKKAGDNTVKAQDSRLSEVDGRAVNLSLSSHTS